MKSLSTWFAYGFSLLAVLALAAAAILNARRPDWFWLGCGVVLATMAIVFLALENLTRTQSQKEFEILAGLRLATLLPDDDLRRRLYVALSLHFAGARAARDFPVSREPRTLPAPAVKRQGRRRGRGRGGRRKLVLLRCG
jgi:hypothetical protein